VKVAQWLSLELRKYTQRVNRCKNTNPSSSPDRSAHSNVVWRNQPLKSPLSWVEISLLDPQPY